MVRVLVPRRFRSFVKVLPKTLKSRSQDAELALMDKIRFARRINGIGG